MSYGGHVFGDVPIRTTSSRSLQADAIVTHSCTFTLQDEKCIRYCGVQDGKVIGCAAIYFGRVHDNCNTLNTTEYERQVYQFQIN